MHSFLVSFALISLLQRKNITIYNTMDARGEISDRPCWASRNYGQLRQNVGSVSVCLFFSFTNNSLTFVANCVRRGSPYALISGKFCFNIFITTEKYYYIQHYGCQRCNF